MRIRCWFLTGSLAALTACAPLTGNQQQDTKTITQEITEACLSSGFFKAANGAVATFVPAAVIPIDLVDAGIDVTCENPALFGSADAVTLDWVIAGLADAKDKLGEIK